MDLKNELENEVLLAILTRKRQAKGIDGDNSRELVSKIKGALKSDEVESITDLASPTPTEIEYVH
jgi:hypothetical protein